MIDHNSIDQRRQILDTTSHDCPTLTAIDTVYLLQIQATSLRQTFRILYRKAKAPAA